MRYGIVLLLLSVLGVPRSAVAQNCQYPSSSCQSAAFRAVGNGCYTFRDNSVLCSADAGSIMGSGWFDILNCSFADAGFVLPDGGNQLPSAFPDAGNDIAFCKGIQTGQTARWLYNDHGHAASPTVMDGGLYIWPDQSSDYWTSGAQSPTLRIQISQLYPAFDTTTSIRMVADLCASNIDGSNYVAGVAGFQLDDTPANHYVALTVGPTAASCQNFYSNTDAIDVGRVDGSGWASNVDGVTLPSGVGEFSPQCLLASETGSLWPAVSAFSPIGMGVLPNALNPVNFGTAVNAPTHWYAILSAKRSNSPTAIYTKWCGLRIQVKSNGY